MRRLDVIDPHQRITEDEYDRYFQSFRDKVASIDIQVGVLQEAEDNYYTTAKYLLKLVNRAYDLFVSSEVEERRQLVKLVLQNLRVEGKEVRYDAIKPFDTIIDYANRQAWLRWLNPVRTFFIEQITSPSLDKRDEHKSRNIEVNYA